MSLIEHTPLVVKQLGKENPPILGCYTMSEFDFYNRSCSSVLIVGLGDTR